MDPDTLTPEELAILGEDNAGPADALTPEELDILGEAPANKPGTLERLAAFGEGALRAPLLGAQTPIAALEAAGTYLGNKAYEAVTPGASSQPFNMEAAQQEMAARAERNPIESGAGLVAGSVLPALVTGGASAGATGAATGGSALARAGATAARYAPSEVLARLAGKAAVRVVPGAAASAVQAGAATSRAAFLRPAAELAAIGMVEGAAYGAAAEVDQSFITGDFEGLAERVVSSSGEGALIGGVLGGSASVIGKAAKAGYGKARKFGAGLPGKLREASGESAYKAAMGRTSRAGVAATRRHGGPAAVGRSLLEEGIPVDDDAGVIQAAIADRLNQVGEEIGAMVQSVSSVAKPDVAKFQEAVLGQVIEPLERSGVNADLAASVRRQLEPVWTSLGLAAGKARKAAEPSFEALNAIRKDMDGRINWDRASPGAELQVRMDVRRVFRDEWLRQADLAAFEAATEGALVNPRFGEQLRDLNRRYAHLAVGLEQAEQRIATELSNRSLSPSDYAAGLGSMLRRTGALGAAGAGAGAYGASGGDLLEGAATGAAVALGHRYLRRHGRGIVAKAMDKAASLIEATAGSRALEVAAESLVRTNAVATATSLATRTAPAARRVYTMAHLDAQMAALEPDSDESAAFSEALHEVYQDSPELAVAVEEARERKAAFLQSKRPRFGRDMFGRPDRSAAMDRAAMQALGRYIDAANDPEAAVARLARGEVLEEDVETLQTLYPRMLADLRAKMAASLSELGKDPGYDVRRRAATALGLDDSDDAAWLQQPVQAQQPSAMPKTKFNAGGDVAMTTTQRVTR